MQNISSISKVYLIITHLTSTHAWTNPSKDWKQKKVYVIKNNKKEKFLKYNFIYENF